MTISIVPWLAVLEARKEKLRRRPSSRWSAALCHKAHLHTLLHLGTLAYFNECSLALSPDRYQARRLLYKSPGGRWVAFEYVPSADEAL